MAGYSSYRSAPGADYYDNDRFATPTPSPRGPEAYYYASTPQRPQTRAHFRHFSSGMNDYTTPRPAALSPRYNSDGFYATDAATANVSATRSSARKPVFSTMRPKRERRSSYSYNRPSDSHGESDEDEYVEVNGVTYVLPAKSNLRRHYARDDDAFYHASGFDQGHGTDDYYRAQTSSRRHSEEHDRYEYESARYYEESPRRSSARRASQPTPQRAQTVRPETSRHKAPPPTRMATDADAKKYGIPKGYSLKNWDPTEEPIIMLGSVFDSNSLGKWIYDWTVYSRGSSTPITEVAGEMWLLLIQLGGKVKRAKETVPRVRTLDNRELLEDFIAGGERLTDKLKKLLKTCEKPMLAGSKKGNSQLGQRSGIEFVDTMFGRERELEKTEKFMQSVRLWNHRFDINCDDVLRHPEL